MIYLTSLVINELGSLMSTSKAAVQPFPSVTVTQCNPAAKPVALESAKAASWDQL